MLKLKTKILLLQTYVSKSVLLITIILFASCGKLNPPKQKPFVIVGKNTSFYEEIKVAEYYYQDAKGNRYDFTDYNNKYNVGDTIR